MLCRYNCEVKIVHQTVKKEDNLIVVWAIGTYLVKHKDNDIEIVLFVPIDSSERDTETQAIFEKNSPLKVSFVGVPQELLNVLENNENAVFKVHKDGNLSPVLNGFVDEFKTKSSTANNTSSKHVKVESCNESENESNHTNSNSIKFNKFTRLNEDVHDNIYNNLLRKKNSQKNKKGKEPVGGSLHSALRSYKSSISFIIMNRCKYVNIFFIVYIF
ncbi:hypothetical protein F8M41_004789 [Gigaspora margarita]|uniref:Uncharacterized protein n=1 Tax=Gigaspora margarita TaxID=4874 RepID=A0A8H3X966_GIGMA|nr:hypothetical protein F8M41_004789 [Gigaspora margarita]